MNASNSGTNVVKKFQQRMMNKRLPNQKMISQKLLIARKNSKTWI